MSPPSLPDDVDVDVDEGRTRRRRRRRWLVGAVVAAGIVVAAAVVWPPQAGTASRLQRAEPNRRAPAVRLPELGAPARQVDLAAFAGQPVVLNFWASWCVPCRKEMPALQRAATRFAGRVAFVGVNHQDSERDALELVERSGVQYPSGYDPDGSVARDFELFGMPTTVFIDAQGRILATRTGEMDEDELRAALDELFRITPP